ncbi:beta strand repeat-containing protein [Chryseobacterium echinoideorum]|uniref:beta strand repeat-containing protein n=1 Tax=Chryseobacterium echinoideorum TaxID=1549648 RepID=UPI001184DA56|nr:pyocin knob domain-containing protein [Chryseobacterium echinoideorum]
MAENEELNFDFDPDNIPDTNTFWNDLDAYWHENRQFPEDTDQKLSKKADLIDGKIPSSQLPSYVDDVLEFDSFGDLPSPGEQGKIYITTNNNFQYRWSGSEYILISSISGTINTIPKFTGSNVIGNSNIIDNGTDTTISKGLRLNPDTVEVTNVGRFLNYIKNNSNETIFSYQTHYWNGSSFQATSYPNINIGQLAGTSSTGAETINIGRFAGQLNSGLSVINLGQFSGMYNSANYVNNLGLYSGQFNTGVHSNNLGYLAGRYNIGVYTNNLGANAGAFNTSGYVNHLGANAGYLNTGLFVNSFGGSVNRYNQGNNVNVFGQSSNYTFKENPSHFKTFDSTAIDLISKTISLPAHGFGATNAYVNLKFTQGTSPITGILDGSIIQVRIVDGNTVAFSDTLTNGYVRQTHNITDAGTGTGHKFNAQLVYSNINIFGSGLEPTKSYQNIISGGEFLMPQSTVNTLDADTTNKTLITKEWFNSKIASYGIASNYYTKTESDGKFIPFTGATANVNLNTRNFETSGRLSTGKHIHNLASRTVQGTGIIDITLPNINVMGVFYIDVFTYGALVGTFICQFYTFYGSSINFAGSNSVTFIGKNPNNVGVRYVSIGTNNNAERHIYIGDLATNWGNWTEISIRGLINVNHDAIKTNPPIINLITSEGSPLNLHGTYLNNLTGTESANSAIKLTNQRLINGTLFDGTGNIITANWGTSRNITIGNTTKTINGSGDASWSLAEIGAISDGSVLKIEGNGVSKHNLIGTDAFGLRNASAWATSTNRPNNTNSAVVNFTPYNTANQTYGFSLGARLNKLFFVTEENSTFGTWNEVYHTGNFNPANYSQTTHTHTFNSLTSKPTTLDGYGITDSMFEDNIRPVSADFDLYKTQGFYALGGNLTNKPLNAGNYGNLLITQSATDRFHQMYFDASLNEVYFRNGTGISTTWGVWKRILTDASTIPYLPLTGGELTGALTIKPSNSGSVYEQDVITFHDQGGADANIIPLAFKYGTSTTPTAYIKAVGKGLSGVNGATFQFFDNTTKHTEINSTGVTSNSFIKLGGTSSQFLKANGSVDTNSYLPLSGGTMTGPIRLGSFSSSITRDYSTTNGNSGFAVDFIKLIGSNGTVDAFGHYGNYSNATTLGTVTLTYGYLGGEAYNTKNAIRWTSDGRVGIGLSGVSTPSTDHALHVSGNQFVFGNLDVTDSISSVSGELVIKRFNVNRIRTGGTNGNSLILSGEGTTGAIYFRPQGDAVTTGQAYLDSTGKFTAESIAKVGGTSSQFLKADGSVDSNSYALNNHIHTFSSITSKPTTLSGYGITDAIPTSHPVNGVNTAQINNWNSAFGWGNHAAAGYATSDFVNESMAQITAEFINPDYPISASCKINTVIITEEYTKEYLELEAELIPERQITVTNLAPFEINVRREDHSIDTIRTGETTEYYITAERRLIKKGSYHSAAFLN